MAIQAQYAATPANAAVTISVANPNRDGTGTIAEVAPAGPNGSRVDDLTITATGTTTAGMIRLFLHDGTTARLWREIPVQAVTPSGTVPAWTAMLTNLELVLQSGWSLRASTQNAESFNVLATRKGHL